MRNLVLGAVALLVSLAAYPAMAGNVRFILTDKASGATLSWVLPESPLPDVSDETSFDLNGPIFGGATDPDLGHGVSILFGISFFTDADSGGLQTVGGAFFPDFSADPIVFSLDLLGEQLFTGATDAPTFRRGVFDLTDGGCTCASVNAADTSGFTLKIGAAVPEPATWALMIGGLGAAGAALRRRRTLAA